MVPAVPPNLILFVEVILASPAISAVNAGLAVPIPTEPET